MPFSDFAGNPGHPSPARDAGARPLSARCHSSGARDRAVHTALMLARAMNCLEQPITGGLTATLA